jgi:hypothetical protein
MDSQKEERKDDSTKSLGEFSLIFKVDLDALMKHVVASQEETFEEDDGESEILTEAFTLVKQGL